MQSAELIAADAWAELSTRIDAQLAPSLRLLAKLDQWRGRIGTGNITVRPQTGQRLRSLGSRRRGPVRDLGLIPDEVRLVVPAHGVKVVLVGGQKDPISSHVADGVGGDVEILAESEEASVDFHVRLANWLGDGAGSGGHRDGW